MGQIAIWPIGGPAPFLVGAIWLIFKTIWLNFQPQICSKSGPDSSNVKFLAPENGPDVIWLALGRQKCHLGAIWPIFGANLGPKIEPDSFKNQPDGSNNK